MSLTGSASDPDLHLRDPMWSLARIEALDPVVRAFVAEADRRQRVETSLAAAPPGPLHGILVGVKDVIRVDGLDTRAGSALPPGVLAGAQATVVDRIQAAGGVVAGKTVTAEFAVSEPGPTRNPRHLDRTPGGSSSGSAAAVAAGMVPLALGTQTVGSVIRPAAYCGVVGFRPTWGVVPLDGVLTNAVSLDTIGFFTPDTSFASSVAAVLYQWEPAPTPHRLPVLGVPECAYLDAANDETRRLFDVQLRRLEDAGYELRRATLVSDVDALHTQLRTLQRFELARTHRDWFTAHAELYRPATAAAVREGQRVTPAAYDHSVRWRDGFTISLQAGMEDAGIDLWVTPAAPGPPPRGLTSTGSAAMSAPFSFAGMPAITLPTLDGDLPNGLQLAAAPHCDRYLLATARDIEAALQATNAPPV